MKKINNHDNRGFSLVELIIVLVILAILAAILVPSLIRYIDEAKNSQDMLDTKNLIVAAQSELSHLYGESSSTSSNKHSVLTETYYESNDTQYNCFCKDSDFAKNILDKVGVSPALFVIGVGQYDVYVKGARKGIPSNPPVITNPRDAYTVYFAAYKRDKDSKTLFYDGEKWTENNPLGNNTLQNYGRNKITINGVVLYLQYYEIANDKTIGTDKFWKYWNN